MGSNKPKPMTTPYANTNTNTFAPQSISGTPEAQAYLNAPLDFGKEYNVDPGAGHREALGEQSVNNRYDSGFMSGVPAWIREIQRNKEIRDVQGQGAYEAQQAEYANQQGNNQLAQMRTAANNARLERVLPQILQTGGQSSGYGTQIVQPQPGFWQRAALTAISGASSLPKFGF